MALSNSERQARYLHRLKVAARGVTPEMVVAAVRESHEQLCRDDPNYPGFDEWLEKWGRKRGKWEESAHSLAGFHDDPDVSDALRNVGAVAKAMFEPPER